MQSFLNRFRRITYSTSYLPEIDGLRFLAIFSVVVILHITHYTDEIFFNNTLIQGDYWRNFVYEGGNGVSLFFIISGFILSVPFARWRLKNDKPVALKTYFLRRLTRLEPPYLIALVIFFIANVWFLNKYSFNELLPHFFASAGYLHTIIYDKFSWVLPIAWSLEIEVQFYILAPLFCLVFLIRSVLLRRALMIAIILASAGYWSNVWNVLHVFVYLHYFFAGILLADLHTSNVTLVKDQNWGAVLGVLALIGFFFIPSINNVPGFYAKLLCKFFLFHFALTNRFIKNLFSLQWITVIGGMCYSIYLLHYGIVSALGYGVMKAGGTTGRIGFAPLFMASAVVLVLALSGVYFLLVEKPFMKQFTKKR